jgi:glycosyltransferase involved in cell wall biosynthesis
MKTYPLVSTLTTVYNRANVVERTIQSIAAQDYPNLEIVLVDNGSTDGTLDVLMKYQSDPRVRIFHFKENTGSGGGRNRCVFNATGKYAAYIDSDDEFSETHALSAMVCAAEERDGEISYLMADCADALTHQITAQGLKQAQYVTLPDVLGGRFNGEHLHLFRREWFAQPGFEEGAYGGEVIAWNRMLRIRPAYYLPYVARLYHREGTDRISHVRRNVITLRYQAYGYEKYLQEYGAEIRATSETYYTELLLAWAKLELLAQHRRKAWQLWWQALMTRPQLYHLRLAGQLCLPTSLVWYLTMLQRQKK